jgi:uncharacterized membrane protein YdcZ (DUF606 family)
VAAAVCTQLIVSAVIDRLGILGLELLEISPLRLAGVSLPTLGTVLVTFR